MKFTAVILPLIVIIILIYGFVKKVDILNAFAEGAKENITVCYDILPSLIILLVSIQMLYSSGAIDIVTKIISPVTDFLGFPSDCIPLALLRPLSGSGAMGVYNNILSQNSPDSFAGRVASVMMGSTETTFYTIAVYFGACKVKSSKRIIFAALLCDFVGFVMSSVTVRLIYC